MVLLLLFRDHRLECFVRVSDACFDHFAFIFDEVREFFELCFHVTVQQIVSIYVCLLFALDLHDPLYNLSDGG